MIIVSNKLAPVKPIDATPEVNRVLAARDEWHTDFEAGRLAFRHGKLPDARWSKAMRDGWNFAGEIANLAATAAPATVQERWADREECEYLPLSEEPGYSESTQPWLW